MPEQAPPAATPPSPTGAPIPTVTHESGAGKPQAVDVTKPISAVEKLGLKGKIQGPKEALGNAATPTATVKADLRKLRERHAPKIVIPRADVKPAEKTEKPAAKVEAPAGPKKDPVTGKFVSEKPADEKPLVDGKPPEAEAKKPEDDKPPVTPTKIKVGDKEMTPEEIAEEIKQLREKAESAKKPGEEKKEPTAEETKAQEEAEAKQIAERRKAFIDRELAKEGDIDEAGLDVILSGGKDAVAKFRELRAKDKLETREYLANEVNRILAERDKALAPILDQHREIESYRAESEFLNAYPDIKGHEKGVEEARKVRQQMHDYYSQTQQKIAQNTATAEEKAHAERYDHATPQEFNDSVAAYVRQRLNIDPNAPKPATPPAATPEAAKPAPAAPAATPPPKPQPKPPTGQPTGGGTGPAAMNEQQMHIAKMRAARGG